ncbi:MAG: geranyl transferase [Gammaproteobacteria bacterium]|nr:geranyl transferase [Gammaproteobacteria bacterium]
MVTPIFLATPGSDFSHRVETYQQRIDRKLERVLPSAAVFPEHLHEAMRYAVLAGGKRVRPLLTFACGEALGLSLDLLDAPATAVELIHAFSLVHDDLPAMDNDELRRGRPTVHIAFDEATAILAGDALQALAFEVLAHDPPLSAHPAMQTRMIGRLAAAAGSVGMTGGQAQDLQSEGQQLSCDQLRLMHERKTGLLIQAATMMACDAQPDLDAGTRRAIESFARQIGLAFQVCDDILDIESPTEMLGKPQGSDAAAAKATYPAVMGLPGAKAYLQELHEAALAALTDLSINTQPLSWMADYITQRNH